MSNEFEKTADYWAKRVEYNVLKIPEYWVVDPRTSRTASFSLVEALYEGIEFAGTEQIVSGTFPELVLTAEQIIGARVISGDKENQ